MGPKLEGPLAALEGLSGGEGIRAGESLHGVQVACQPPSCMGWHCRHQRLVPTPDKLPTPQVGVPVPVRVGAESLGEQKPGLCSGVTFATPANVPCLGPTLPPTG